MAHLLAQQRHAAGHTATLAAAEHRYLQADFAVAGSNGAGVGMVAMHIQAATVSEGLVGVQCLLEGGLELGGDLAFQLGFRVVQQSHNNASPVGGWALYPHLITKPPRKETIPSPSSMWRAGAGCVTIRGQCRQRGCVSFAVPSRAGSRSR